MDTFIKTLPKKITTKQTGIYYKEIQKTVVNDGDMSTLYHTKNVTF
jgi:hypothetical protein